MTLDNVCYFVRHVATKRDGMERLLSSHQSSCERLAQDNMETIAAYGDSFMETLARDACDGHHVGRVCLSACLRFRRDISLHLHVFLSIFISS